MAEKKNRFPGSEELIPFISETGSAEYPCLGAHGLPGRQFFKYKQCSPKGAAVEQALECSSSSQQRRAGGGAFCSFPLQPNNCKKMVSGTLKTECLMKLNLFHQHSYRNEFLFLFSVSWQ